jgi:hypothetical protein
VGDERMSDYFKTMRENDKKERQELAVHGLKELLKTDWMKERLFKEKTLEDSIRWGVNEFLYDIHKHEEEMIECPKLEELLINISREQLEGSIPSCYEDFVAQTDRDRYLHSCASLEEITVELGSYIEDALDDFDYEELELSLSKEVHIK